MRQGENKRAERSEGSERGERRLRRIRQTSSGGAQEEGGWLLMDSCRIVF